MRDVHKAIERIKSWHAGARWGMKRYAIERNGVEYVGADGWTLKRALHEIDEREDEAIEMARSECVTLG